MNALLAHHLADIAELCKRYGAVKRQLEIFD